MTPLKRPLLRGWSHVLMFLIGLCGCSYLIRQSDPGLETIATTVYSIAALILFGVSSIYHRVFWKNPHTRLFMGRLDHSAIYLMIAGGFAPICLLVLPEEQGHRLFILVWIVTTIGILKALFFIIPKWVSSVFYVLVSFMVLPYFSQLWNLLDGKIIFLMIAGGVSYIIGAACYALKWPRLVQHIFGYHEVFHMLVNIGAILHYFMVFAIIKR